MQLLWFALSLWPLFYEPWAPACLLRIIAPLFPLAERCVSPSLLVKVEQDHNTRDVM